MSGDWIFAPAVTPMGLSVDCTWTWLQGLSWDSVSKLLPNKCLLAVLTKSQPDNQMGLGHRVTSWVWSQCSWAGRLRRAQGSSLPRKVTVGREVESFSAWPGLNSGRMSQPKWPPQLAGKLKALTSEHPSPPHLGL